MEIKKYGSGKLDIVLCCISFALIAVTIAWALIDNNGFIAITKLVKDVLVENMSWFLILFINTVVIILLYLACSRFGSRRLGRDEDRPEMSTFSWIALLISCGAAAGFCFWPIAEPLWHYFNTPYIAKSATPDALVVARSIALFHWGLHLWGLFCITGLCIAYPAFRNDRPLTIPGALYGLLGERCMTSIWGRIAEICASFATLTGVGATLALGMLLLSSGVHAIFGVEINLTMQAVIMAAIIAIYSLAAWSGLTKGIKLLGDMNAYLCFAWLFYILIAGPTSTLLDGMVETLGAYLSNMITMATFVDASEQSNNWHGDWSVFYYMWNIAWAPLVGGFIARISRGRTLREYIFGTLLLPTAVAVIWFGIIGTASQYVVTHEINDLWAVVQQEPAMGLYVLVDAFGGGLPLKLLIFGVCCTLLLTSADAASYFMAMLMSRGSLNPKPTQMLIWGVLIGCLGVIFLSFGGISGVQTAGVIAGAPFLFILVAMIISIFKVLYSEDKQL